MKRLLLLLSAGLLLCGQVWAQAQTITGTVLNAADNEPVIGASVQVDGTTKGTITDFDGKFSLEVEPGAMLTVSFIGMQSQQVTAKDGITVSLTEDSKELDEVMVSLSVLQPKSRSQVLHPSSKQTTSPNDKQAT